MTGRVLLGAAGVAMAVFGCWHLLQGHDLTWVVVWLVGAVAIHDGLVAPLTIGVVALAAAVLPPRLRRPVAVALIVLLTVTATAVPVLGGWGRRADNATLLDRHYWIGWWVFTGLVLAGTLVGILRNRVRRPRRGR